MKLYLVRHGQTNANKDHYVPGKEELLNHSGVLQAEVLAQRFSDIHLDAIITSDYIRARQTANPLAESRGLPIEEQSLMGEFFEPTSMTGLSYEHERVAVYRTERDSKLDTEPDWKHEDGESFSAFGKRIQAAKNHLENRSEEALLVVAHAFFIKAFVTGLIRCSYEPSSDWLQAMFMTKTTNTGITAFTVTDGTWKIDTVNDELHFAE